MKLPVLYASLTPDMRREVREEYIRIQEGDCAFCDEPLAGDPSESVMTTKVNRRLFPAGFFDNPIHLHHDHATGYTLGAVHARCNAVLWEYFGE